MRLILKSLWRGLRGFVLICMLWLSFAPASSDEVTALGAELNRFNLVQLRLARAMLAVAPDFAVARYADATDMPPDLIRAHLEAKANGDDIFAAAPQAEVSGARRIEAGGALFVQPD